MSLESLKKIVNNVKNTASEAVQKAQTKPASESKKPEAKPAVKNEETTSASNDTTPSVFDRMTSWRDSHEENVKNAQKRLDDKNEVKKYGAETIFEEYEKKEKELGLEFDFMDGKDPSNEEDYNAQIHELAQGDFDKKDANGDGKVSFEEYIADEAASLDENDDTYTKAITKTYSYLMASLMDQAMGNSNNDGELSVEEFESFYKNLDSFNGTGFNDNGDGKITPADFDMPAWLIENIFSEDTIDRVFDLALEDKI